jgi:hypothetical protein
MTQFWHVALLVGLAVIGVRIAMLAWRVVRHEVAWTRLLVPGIVAIEGIGFATHDEVVPWTLRLGTAALLEITFVVIAVRELRRPTAGFIEDRIARAFGALLPPTIARFAALEIVIVGMAVRFVSGGWRRATPPGFTYHRQSGLRMFLPMLPLLAVGDVLLLELVLLRHADTWLRIVVHALAIYGLVWLVGLYASLRARPHRLADGVVTLHRGLLRRLDVRVDEIASIAPLPAFADDWKKRAYTRGALRLDVAGPSILEIRLHAGTRVLVAVDEPAPFVAALGPAT